MKELTEKDIFNYDNLNSNRFCFDLNSKEGVELRCISGGRECCEDNYFVKRDSFPFLSIEFVAAGEGKLSLNENRYVLKPGAIFSYGPGVPHQIQTSPGAKMVKYFLDFSGSRAEELLSQATLSPGSFGNLFQKNDFAFLFEKIVTAGQSGTRFSQQTCTSLLYALLYSLSDANVTTGEENKELYKSYLKCLGYINENFKTLTNLNQISANCELNKSYLCRLFKMFHHETPYSYLMKKKMDYAIQRLQEPEVLIKQIADELCFSDPYQFSRSFKRTLGISPAFYHR